MGTLSEDLTAIKNVEDTLVANKVARFSYTDTAYTNNDANGVDTYDYDNEQNIPNPTTSILKVNSTVLDKGYRAQASSITRMLINHFFGRVSYNLNKINDNMSSLIATLRSHTGTANGFATLDANGRIPYSQLPESAVELKGYWNASTNTPTLADGTGTNGDEYLVDTAGSQDLGSGTQYFGVGDRAVYTGGVWKNISSGFIRTINGQAPNAQGEREVILGKNVPVTKTLLGAIFGCFIGKYWKHSTGVTFLSSSSGKMLYGNGIWVGFGTHGLYWSEDGKSWTQCTGRTSSTQYVMYCSELNIWICDGFWWSEDGKNWTQNATSPSTSINTIFYNNDLFVACSNASLYWSEDGKNWTQCEGISSVVVKNKNLLYANNIWICGGVDKGIWWSEDGKNWAQETDISSTSDFDTENKLMYANGIFIVTPRAEIPWWSEDGKNWTQCTGFSTAYTGRIVGYYNGIWVGAFGGQDVWWSTDGKNWTQGTGIEHPQTVEYYAGVPNVFYANGFWYCQSQYSPSLGVLKYNTYASKDGKNWEIFGGAFGGDGLLSDREISKFIFINGVWFALYNKVNNADSAPRWSTNGKNFYSCLGFLVAEDLRDIVYGGGCLLGTSYGVGYMYSSLDDVIEDGTLNIGSFPLLNA